MKKLIIALLIAAPTFADKCHKQVIQGEKVKVCIAKDGSINILHQPTFEQRMQAAQLQNLQLQNMHLAFPQMYESHPLPPIQLPVFAPPPPAPVFRAPVTCTSQVLGNQLQTVCN